MKESQLTVRTDTLWLSKRTKQSSGIYLEKCCVFVRFFSEEGGLSIVFHRKYHYTLEYSFVTWQILLLLLLAHIVKTD